MRDRNTHLKRSTFDGEVIVKGSLIMFTKKGLQRGLSLQIRGETDRTTMELKKYLNILGGTTTSCLHVQGRLMVMYGE